MKGFIAVMALALLAGCSNFNLFNTSAPADNWTTWTCDSQAKVLWRYTDDSLRKSTCASAGPIRSIA